MKSRSDSLDRSEMFTRLTATVTMSAPEASWAFTMTAFDGYFPVPMMRRDWNVLPAMTNVSEVILGLSATDKIHDFDVIAFADHRRVECGALEDDEDGPRRR